MHTFIWKENDQRQRASKRKTEVNRKRKGPEFSQAAMFRAFDTGAVDSREVRRLIEHYFRHGFQHQVVVLLVRVLCM